MDKKTIALMAATLYNKTIEQEIGLVAASKDAVETAIFLYVEVSKVMKE